MTPVKILAFTGSMRAQSLNRKLVAVAAAGARAAGAQVTELALRDLDLPLYDGDLEARDGLPAAAGQLKALLKDHHGFLISSPENNSSVSAALKNAIDWASRPVPGEPPLVCFKGKVAVLMAASTGALGGLRGLVTLRMILGNIGTIVLPEQRAIPSADKAFGDDGRLRDPELHKAVEALGARLTEVLTKLL